MTVHFFGQQEKQSLGKLRRKKGKNTRLDYKQEKNIKSHNPSDIRYITTFFSRKDSFSPYINKGKTPQCPGNHSEYQ